MKIKIFAWIFLFLITVDTNTFEDVIREKYIVIYNKRIYMLDLKASEFKELLEKILAVIPISEKKEEEEDYDVIIIKNNREQAILAAAIPPRFSFRPLLESLVYQQQKREPSTKFFGRGKTKYEGVAGLD